MAPLIFISYAHKDNEEHSGFVMRLKGMLQESVAKNYRGEIRIFTDTDTPSGADWKIYIGGRLSECQIFLPIVSEQWLASPVAKYERELVWPRLGNNSGLKEQTCILPISFNFSRQQISAHPVIGRLQVRHYLTNQTVSSELEKVADEVAKEIADLLCKLEKEKARETHKKRVGEDEKNVFLGFAFSPQMQLWKKSIHDQLAGQGYRIREQPYDPLSTAQEMSDAIQRITANCVAVIHFLEERPGPSASGDPSRSLIQIQCDTAKPKMLPAIEFFWTGPDLKTEKVEDKAHQTFLENLPYTNEKVFEFSKLIDECLKQKPESPDDPEPEKLPVICLIYESGDQEIADEIQSFFAEKGWPVDIPDENVAQKEVPDSFDRAFAKNKYFFFYWGQGKRPWCVRNYRGLLDARRENGTIDKHAVLAVLYFGWKKEPYKESFDWPWHKVRKYDRFDPNCPEVRDFVREVERRTNARAI